MLGILVAFLIGLLLAAAALAPRGWLSWIAAAGLALPVGAGATALPFFALTWAGTNSLPAVLAADAAVFAAAVACFIRRRGGGDAREQGSTHPLLAVLAFGALALALSAAAARTNQIPLGSWEAFTEVNLRARYLAGEGAQWRNAVSPDLIRSEPSEPLLMPAAVARLWRYSDGLDPDVPKLFGFLLLLSAPVLLFGSIARTAGANAGLLGLIALAASGPYLVEGAAQGTAAPLSLMAAGAIACGFAGKLGLGGLLAGCAAFTQDEGIVFAAAWLAAFPARSSIAAAAPGLAATAAFKALLAPARVTAAAPELPDIVGLGYAAAVVAILAFGAGLAAEPHPSWPRAAAAMGATGIAAAFLSNVPAALFTVWPALLLLALLRLNPFPAESQSAPADKEDHREAALPAGRGRGRRK